MERHYASHNGNLNAQEIMDKANDQDFWTVSQSHNVYGGSQGYYLRKYASEASYKDGYGKPFLVEHRGNLVEKIRALDSKYENSWKDATLLGINVAGTVLSGGMLAVGGKTAGAVVNFVGVAATVANVDGLMANPNGQTPLEALSQAIGGDMAEDAIKGVKLTFGVIDLRNGLANVSGYLNNGWKVEGAWDVANNMFSTVSIIQTTVQETTPKTKKADTIPKEEK